MKIIVGEYSSGSKVLIALDDSHDEVEWINDWINQHLEVCPGAFKVTELQSNGSDWVPYGLGAMVYYVNKSGWPRKVDRIGE